MILYQVNATLLNDFGTGGICNDRQNPEGSLNLKLLSKCSKWI